MTEKRFELIPNLQGQVDIVDHIESKEKNAICIYNDLGVLPFTSAPSLCDLLNNLAEENKQLEEENEEFNEELMECDSFKRLYEKKIERLEKENEQLKEGMIGVVDRYIKNVDCNPPSSAHTYIKIKGALVNVREDLRNLISDLDG